MNIELPTVLINWGTLIGVVVAASAFTFFQWKNQSNKLLRDQVNDMDERIKFLESKVANLQKENGDLKTDYNNLKFKKNYLKQIVIEALATKKGISESLMDEISGAVTLVPKEKM